MHIVLLNWKSIIFPCSVLFFFCCLYWWLRKERWGMSVNDWVTYKNLKCKSRKQKNRLHLIKSLCVLEVKSFVIDCENWRNDLQPILLMSLPPFTWLFIKVRFTDVAWQKNIFFLSALERNGEKSIFFSITDVIIVSSVRRVEKMSWKRLRTFRFEVLFSGEWRQRKENVTDTFLPLFFPWEAQNEREKRRVAWLWACRIALCLCVLIFLFMMFELEK